VERRFKRIFSGGSCGFRQGDAIIDGVIRVPAGLAILTLVLAACGGSPAIQAGRPRASATLAFARCMRSHGVPSFPDPDAQGNFPSFSAGVSKQISVAANEDCKQLLAQRSSSATPGQQQQKLVFGVKVAGCLRAHGYPNFPDPTRLGSQPLPPGVDLNSPQFQAAETACEKQERKALGPP
jgi:hypothetical protein